MIIYQLDQNNFYIGFSELTEENQGTLNYTRVQMTVGYVRPLFSHQSQTWSEGATQEEIDAYHEANKPSETTPDQNVILSEKVTALEEKVATLESTVNSLVASQPV